MKIFKTTIFLMDVRPLKEDFSFYLNQVSLERKLKISRLKSINARSLSLGAGLLLNEVFTSYEIDPRAEIIRNQNGKPFLKDLKGFEFNLSHSGDFVICAINSKPVGIDIQKIREANLKLAKRFFHDKEFEFLTNLSSEMKKIAFNHLWTAKESYIKYLGTGLSTPLNSFNFQIDFKSAHGKIEGEKVYFKNYQGPENYLIYCCAKEDNFDEDLKRIALKRSGSIGE